MPTPRNGDVMYTVFNGRHSSACVVIPLDAHIMIWITLPCALGSDECFFCPERLKSDFSWVGFLQFLSHVQLTWCFKWSLTRFRKSTDCADWCPTRNDPWPRKNASMGIRLDCWPTRTGNRIRNWIICVKSLIILRRPLMMLISWTNASQISINSRYQITIYVFYSTAGVFTCGVAPWTRA